MIVDLSLPKGFSINDGISPELSSLSYVSLDHLASLVTSVGRGALLVKADIKEAYRMVPIHPNDQHLLGIWWEDSVYIDRMLPFGLRSAPKIFSAIADTLQWIKASSTYYSGGSRGVVLVSTETPFSKVINYLPITHLFNNSY